MEDNKENKAEAAISVPNGDWDSIFNAVTDSITIQDADFNIIRLNQAAQKMLGLQLENQTSSAKCFRCYHGADKPPVDCTSCQTLRMGRLAAAEIFEPFLNKHLEVRSIPRLDDNNQLAGLIHVVRDVTYLTRVEKVLQESLGLYHSLFENMLNGFAYCRMLFDQGSPQDFIYLVVNSAFKALTGLKNVAGKKASELTPGLRQADDWFFEICGRVALTGQPEKFEKYVDSLKMWCSISIYSPEKEYFVAIFDVITERKQAEEERFKLEAQLRQAQKMESVGRLAGGVAHDFNNMLGVILGHTELALDRVDPSNPLHADLMEIRKAASHSADLTRQLLGFARKQIVAPRVLDLNDTVTGMLKMLHRLIGEDIDLHWQPGVGLWPVNVDPSQIDQILANLCVNARDAISGIGKMTIETTNSIFNENYCAAHIGFIPGEYVLLAVGDTGCGMGKETLSHLFEPFFTTKGIGKGTGLGLATVYGIVKQNRGFINVDSEPGQGTTFKIYLPRHRGETKTAPAEALPESLTQGRETVLVVEDESALLDLSKLMLEEHGYRVLTAGTPGDALRLAEEHDGEIHLLITDVVLPEMNGGDLAQQILSLYPNIKRLFMSGYTDDIIAHHGVLDDGLYFLPKPFSIKDLAAKVREVLDQK